MFGVGFAHAEDRMLLMDTLRNPGRAAVIDAPGLNPFALAQSFQPFNTSQQTEDFVAQQVPSIQSMPGGQRLIDDFDNYIAGINEYRTQAGTTGRPWNRNDVISVAALIGAVFGKGGGDEARRAQLLSALQDRLGQHKGEQVWRRPPRGERPRDGDHARPAVPDDEAEPERQGQRDRRRGQPERSG